MLVKKEAASFKTSGVPACLLIVMSRADDFWRLKALSRRQPASAAATAASRLRTPAGELMRMVILTTKPGAPIHVDDKAPGFEARVGAQPRARAAGRDHVRHRSAGGHGQRRAHHHRRLSLRTCSGGGPAGHPKCGDCCSDCSNLHWIFALVDDPPAGRSRCNALPLPFSGHRSFRRDRGLGRCPSCIRPGESQLSSCDGRRDSLPFHWPPVCERLPRGRPLPPPVVFPASP